MLDWLKSKFSLPAIDRNICPPQKVKGDDSFKAGKYPEAENYYRQALLSQSNSPEIIVALGNSLNFQGKHQQAFDCYQQAIKLDPKHALAYNNLANLLQDMGRIQEAVQCFEVAIALKPDMLIAFYNLGVLCQSQKKHDLAAACYRKVLELDPGHMTARMNLTAQLMHMCEWDNIDTHTNILRRDNLESPAGDKNILSPFNFLSLPGNTAAEQQICARKWVKNEYQPFVRMRDSLKLKDIHANDKLISVGYLSADFREHAVAHLMANVFELHDREIFRIHGYAYGFNDNSAMRTRLENAFDHFTDISLLSYAEAAQKINDDNIDILVDLTGHTANSRSAILALRPAPIQVNYLGYPGTMGANFVDYIIADKYLIPEEYKQYYTERVVYMPDCFQANDSNRPHPHAPSRIECNLPEESVIFCCFNQAIKITPEMFNIWCELLRQVPNSILWLVANEQQAVNLKREVQKRGLTVDRLVFAQSLPYEKHLARLQCASIFLDTYPFNAGTTCSEALWMGLPVITYSGDSFASRMAGSLLASLDLHELIANSTDQYLQIAIDLAIYPEKLQAVKHKIQKSRVEGRLFDSSRFTRNLESLYCKMMEEEPLHKTAKQIQ